MNKEGKSEGTGGCRTEGREKCGRKGKYSLKQDLLNDADFRVTAGKKPREQKE